MDEKRVSGSFMITSEENGDRLCPMFFGVSCAFFALKLLPEPEIFNDKWSEMRNQMLKGAHLLGLLVWTVQRKVVASEKLELVQKLETAEKEIKELKKRRSEDAKANEKVVSIFAGREQSWFDERKKLRQQIGALMNDLRVLETKKEKSISELGEKMKEIELILQWKDKVIEETERKRLENEEKMVVAENVAAELRESVKSEAERYSSEIFKHKTAFIELVSNQRQVEAEMGRTLRQVEAAKQELDSVLEQKEQLVLVNQRLSMELVKMHKDLEQKDQILSAMLRKSKVDTAEKQMLLKEVKSSKAKRKQAELETAKWKAVSESKQERHSLRNVLSKHVNVKSDAFGGGKFLQAKAMMSSDAGNHKSGKMDYCFEYKHPEMRKGLEVFSFVSDPYLTDGIEEPKLTADAKHWENWVNSEAEKYKIAIDQRHQVEVDTFMEQLRQKDEKLEAYSWRLMSMELESKRLQSHIEALDHEITQVRQDNMKLEAVLLDCETELHSIQEQLIMRPGPPNPQKLRLNSSQHDGAMGENTVWSRVKVVKRKSGRRRQEMKAMAKEISQFVENDMVDETSANELQQDIILTLQSPNKETKEGKVSKLQPDHSQHENIDSEDVVNAEPSKPIGQGLSKRNNSTWKMDIHALGVSYKVKRLKQQLFMLERLTGKKESCGKSENNKGEKGFYALMSHLNKQVDRYQSLQGKIDDLCMRMHENNLNLKRGSSTVARLEGETKRMEHFLEETFQLQRYIVATGQKLMEVQAKIASSFVADAEDTEKPASFDIERFADSVKTLFREVQRGLEVRISRIIGALEGTLACDGFHTSRK